MGNDKARVGVLILDNFHQRSTRKNIYFDAFEYFGLRAILSELNEPYEFTSMANINNYDYILVSLTSVYDVENLVYTFERHKKEIKPEIIVGGAGVVNIKLYSKYIDVACFGRGEGQINEIISGKALPNVWRKEDDPHFDKVYEFRQPQYLVKGETNVGCRNKCFFCQYTWLRKHFIPSTRYNSQIEIAGVEDDWRNLNITDGRYYVTALDGLSEKTRFMINKKITDEDIKQKLSELYKKNIKTRISLKIFQIVGYPWETVESVVNDLQHFKHLIGSVDDNEQKMDMKMFLLFTPFSPEPLTPMQSLPANIYTDWRYELVVKRNYFLYDGNNFQVRIMQYINSPYTLVKRVMINRGVAPHLDAFKKLCFSKALKRYPAMQKVKILMNKNIIEPEMFGVVNKENAAWSYLRTYTNVWKLSEKLINDTEYLGNISQN